MKIYIIGFNSFIAKHLYISLKRLHTEIFLVSHNEIEKIQKINPDDIVINCCGVNRASTKEEYENGNYIFIQNLFKKLDESPYLIHLSSIMVYGFKNISNDQLSDYQRWFIETKLKGEHFLTENYNKDKLCILRPSNVYGYDCIPYYNNLVSTLVYEKIHKYNKVSKINKNCIRNMISVDSLVTKIADITLNKKTGIYNIISSNDMSLYQIVNYLYLNNDNNGIQFTDGEINIINSSSDNISGENIIITEDFEVEIVKLENSMKYYYSLLDIVTIKKIETLSQHRGDMVEITDLLSNRLYKITITPHSVRGNHYHYNQIEDFYINSNKVLFLLALADFPDIIYFLPGNKNDLVRINPYVIHTLSNDFLDNISEIIISSTQKYIQNEVPDTKYINLI